MNNTRMPHHPRIQKQTICGSGVSMQRLITVSIMVLKIVIIIVGIGVLDITERVAAVNDS